MTATLSPSASSAVASLESVLSSLAVASKAAQSSIDSLENKHAKPASYKIIGILLAVASGLFIGSSFVFKKKGLLSSQKNDDPSKRGEGHAYLKSPMWWTGMIIMVIGEICNFVAYAFADAILVTPLGALSVVICAILSSIFLKEKLSLFGKVGCFLCILGATIIALNGPEESTASTIVEFQKLFLAPGFLVFGSVVIVSSLVLVFFIAPKFGKSNMLVYISVCSLIGGLSVSCTQGLGSSIVTSIGGNNQFKHWFIYFLLAFVVVTLLTEINYLNKALELFNTALVTPTYYVLFTFCTLVTSTILYQGFKASVTDIITVVLGFLVICCGITLLQMSKIDPEQLSGQVGVDRRSTILLAAARSQAQPSEKHTEEEDPGMDAIRGGAGIIGSIYRAKSARRSIQGDSNGARRRWRHTQSELPAGAMHPMSSLARHQLYDKPMPMPDDALERISMHSREKSPLRENSVPLPSPSSLHSQNSKHIGFAEEVTSHRYPKPIDSRQATHETTVPISGAHDRHPGLPPNATHNTYRDPFSSAEMGHLSMGPRAPAMVQQGTGRSNESFNTRLNKIDTSPDLSLQDPRAKKRSPLFQSKRSHGSESADDLLEEESLVRSPLNDHHRNSMDDPTDDDHSGSEDEPFDEHDIGMPKGLPV